MVRRFYPAVLERGAKETFAVWFPDFPDCVAGGRSQEDAVAKGERALAVSVERLSEKDWSLPEPTPFEKIVIPKGARFVAFFAVGVDPPKPSERVNIYLPKGLLSRADERAAELGMSRSSFFGLAISTLIGLGSKAGLQGLRMARAEARRIVVPDGKKPR
ncbi:MAG TPA: type II toxin-antitoxin system HicB family antitoxin [Rhizomicrobium sp.]|jgi:predicted RNase H-like HicB family nuclease